ncbi:MAG: DUF4386 domain-containing protein [Gemmatimonadaceae bacterium]
MSPRTAARIAGALYLATMILGVIAQTAISGRLVVIGDAAATAANITASPGLLRVGLAIYLVEMACQVAMTVVFYNLFRPVSRTVSLLAAAFGLVGITVKIVSRLFFISPLLVLGGASYLTVFAPDQLQALSLLFLRVNYTAETIAMVFFGLYALVMGYLIVRSTFLPRVLGVLSALGGIGWVTYLYEPLAVSILPFILGASLIGALAKIGWLLVYGVDEARWREQSTL